jgi:hypothetical protein
MASPLFHTSTNRVGINTLAHFLKTSVEAEV